MNVELRALNELISFVGSGGLYRTDSYTRPLVLEYVARQRGRMVV